MSFCKAIKGVIIAACFSLYGGTGFAGGHGEANAFGFTLVVPAEEVDRVERLLASHKEFMNNTHSVMGDDEARLNSYSVIKAPEMVQFGDPSKGSIPRTEHIPISPCGLSPYGKVMLLL